MEVIQSNPCIRLVRRLDQNNLMTILKRSGCRSAAADTRSLDLSIDYLISETSMNDFHYNLVDG